MESSKVEIASDNQEKYQWGKGFLFNKEGRKLTLNQKKLAQVAIILFLALAVFQLLDNNSGSVSQGSAVASPDTSTPQKTITLDDPSHPQTIERKVASGKQVKLKGPQVFSRPRNLKTIPPGSFLAAKLLSGASNGPVRAEATENLMVNGEELIATGSTLVGRGSSQEERLQIIFDKVVFKDGSFGDVEAVACDSSDKIAGLKGSKIGTKTLNILGSVGLGFVGGLSEGLQETKGEGGVAIKKNTVSNALLNASSRTALEQSQYLMSDLKEAKPIIEVEVGKEILILFSGGK